VDEGHRPGACLSTGTQAAAQVALDRIQKNAQGGSPKLQHLRIRPLHAGGRNLSVQTAVGCRARNFAVAHPS